MSGQSQFSLLTQRRFLPFFTVQALNAFNDNVYRQAIIAFLIFMGIDTEERTLYTNLAPALFILPYFLFSATAGQIAEKMEKARLIRIATLTGVIVMLVGAFGFITRNLPILLIALFGTGLQSTLFGPVKYSILPSVLKPKELTGGNGLVEMGTSISVLIGMIFGGLIVFLAGSYGPIMAAIAVVLIATTANLVSYAIPRTEAGDPNLKINWNPIPETLAVLRLTRKQKAVGNAVLGISWFWFIGTFLTAQLPAYAEVNLGGAANDSQLYILTLALFSIGVGVGSLLCEKLSGRTVEIGLVPLGSFGISAFMLDLYFARPGEAATAGLSVMEFVRQSGSVRIILDLTGIGVFTGFFTVPLFALIQNRTPRNEISRVIAGLNIQNALFIVMASILGVAAHQLLKMTVPQMLLALAIANLLVAIYIYSLVPEFLMRFISWVLVRTLYRLRVRDIEQIPEQGPALIVCNHVSYMDALILLASIHRPVRFVMYYKIFEIPGLHWLFRQGKAIPIASAQEDLELMQRAFDQIDQALAEGELVGIFPEGMLTGDGKIAHFKKGVERILQRRPVPVIPMALKGMWSSMWSRRDSRLGRMRLPRRFRAHVEVVTAAAIPGNEVTAAGLETEIRALRGSAA